MVSVLRKQDPANQYTGFICTARRHVALKNIIALCRELQNVKPVRRPLFRPRAVPHTLKLHAFLVTLYCTLNIQFAQSIFQCLGHSANFSGSVFRSVFLFEGRLIFPIFPKMSLLYIFLSFLGNISLKCSLKFPCLSWKCSHVYRVNRVHLKKRREEAGSGIVRSF